MQRNSSNFMRGQKTMFYSNYPNYYYVNYLKKKDYNINIEHEPMKKNNFFKKVKDQSETVIDIDNLTKKESTNDSKYIYYPVQKSSVIDDIDNKQYNYYNQDKVTSLKISDSPVNKQYVKEIDDKQKAEEFDELAKKLAEQDLELKNSVEKNIIKNVERVEKKSEQKVEEDKMKNEIKETQNFNSVEEKYHEYTEENLLYNLKIISELNVDDKLSYDMNSNMFSIDVPGYTQGINRWWYGEDRDKTLGKLNEIIDATFEYMDNTFTNKVKIPGSSKKEERVLYENNSQIMQKFYITLMDTIKGLDKLKTTYSVDKSVTTKLNLLMDKIRRRTDKINEILKIVPNK